MADPITIRRAETPEDYRALQAAQRLAWGITEESYVIPIATMVGAQLHGGLVLGGFLPGGEAVALSFGFLGRADERLCLYSQLTGVIPGHQGTGIGRRMKLAQRDWALSQGLDLMVWAFDPLQSGNAHFNLTHLGAVAARFVPNMYGSRTDALNAGTPTDRLIVHWELMESSPSLRHSDTIGQLPHLIATSIRADGKRAVERVIEEVGSSRMFLEIPPDVLTLRRDDPVLADQWRLAASQAFRFAFDAGYRAVSFVRETDPTGPRCGYVLQRGHSPTEPLATTPSLF